MDLRFPSDAQFDLIVADGSLTGFASAGDRLRCFDLALFAAPIEDGDIVVAERASETLTRRVRRLGARIELWPLSGAGAPEGQGIVIHEDAVSPSAKIIAKVLLAYRLA